MFIQSTESHSNNKQAAARPHWIIIIRPGGNQSALYTLLSSLETQQLNLHREGKKERDGLRPTPADNDAG